MKKSKLMKALLVFGMSVVTATSIVGFTACGHDHIDEDQDGKCDICDEVMTPADGDDDGNGGNQGGDNTGGGNEGGGNEGGGNEGGGETETKEFKEITKIDISSLAVGTAAGGVELATGSGISPSGDLTVKAGARNYTYNGTDTKSVNCIQVGKGSAKMLKVNLTEASTVLVYAYSGGPGTERFLTLADSTGKELTEGSQKQSIGDDVGQFVGVATFNLETGENYIMSAGDTINVIYIAVVQNLDKKEVKTKVDAEPSSCGVAGNPVYYTTNFGRYYKEDGTTLITKQADLITPALEHSYTLKAGSIVIPTDDPDTNPGKATLTCANGHETDVELPVLSSDKYTTRPEVDVEGTYTITVEGVQISFTAVGVGVKQTTYTDVYKIENFTDVIVGTEKTADQNCVYTSSGTAAADTDGSLKCGEGINATSAYISLGAPITSGVVKITGSIKVASTNGSWTFLQFLNSDETSAEFLGFRTGSKGVWGYRLDGGTPPATPIAAATTVFHNFEILLDFDSKKVTIKVDETVLADNVDLGTKATGLSSIMINCNAGRYIHLGSVTIATQD